MILNLVNDACKRFRRITILQWILLGKNLRSACENGHIYKRDKQADVQNKYIFQNCIERRAQNPDRCSSLKEVKGDLAPSSSNTSDRFSHNQDEGCVVRFRSSAPMVEHTDSDKPSLRPWQAAVSDQTALHLVLNAATFARWQSKAGCTHRGAHSLRPA